MRFAIQGETPRFPRTLRYSRPSLPIRSSLPAELEAIVHSGVLNKGPWIDRFERRLAAWTGTEEAVMFSSGSSAFTLLVRALGVVDSEVVLPAFLFPPVARAVLGAPARPRFADVSPRRWTMGRREAEAAVGTGEGPGLIVGFHLFGLPAPAVELERLGAGRGAPVIFDAAHAFGSELSGRRCGSFGVAEFFSLTPSKLVTGGEGGAVTTNDGALAAELRKLRNYGKDEADGRFSRPGMSARPVELSACVACASLEALPGEVARRRELVGEYRRALAPVGGIALPELPEGGVSGGHEFAVRIDAGRFGIGRDELAGMLAAEGIETRGFYRIPAHRSLPAEGGGAGEGCPVADELSRELLQLPLSPDLKEGDPSAVAALLGEIGAQARAAGGIPAGEDRR